MKILFVYYVLVLVLCLVQARTASEDQCVIEPDASGQVRATPERIVQCFNAIELTADRKENTIEILRQLVALYSFSDILKAKIPPWNTELEVIANKEYPRDYDFHSDLQRLFTSLNDAHTLYIPPNPYSNCFAFKPFGLAPQYQSQKVFLDFNPVFLQIPIVFNWGFDPSKYYGAEVTAISNEPTYDYLKKYADRYVGQYRDLSVRFNALFQSYGWGLINSVLIPLSDIPTETLTLSFANGTTAQLEVPVRVSCNNVFQGLDAVKKLIDTPVAKRSLLKEQDDEYNRGQIDVHREMREYIERIIKPAPIENNNEGSYKEESFEKKQTNAFAKLEQLKLGKENFKNFIEVSSSNNIGINLFIDKNNNVVPVLRILSFMPTTVDDINDFAATLTIYKNLMAYYKFNYTVVDVRGNGGGVICLSLFLSAMLSQEFAHTDQADPALWLPFNLKKSSIAENYYMNDLTQREMFMDPRTGVLMTSPDFYLRSWKVTYNNGVESKMTDKAYFPAFCKQFILDANMGKLRFWPENIMIITDGMCGSACAQFVAKMSQSNRALVVAYGGLFDNNISLRSGSLPGGNVLEFPGNGITLTYPELPTFKTSARARFNNAQSYARLSSTLPLEFDYEAFTPTMNIKEYLFNGVSTNSIVDYSSAIAIWPDFQQVANISMGGVFVPFPTSNDDPIIIDTSMLVQENIAPWAIIAIIGVCLVLIGGIIAGIVLLIRFIRRRGANIRLRPMSASEIEDNTEYRELVDEVGDLKVSNNQEFVA